MSVERQGKTSLIAAMIVNAHRHGFAVILSEIPTHASDSGVQS